VVGSDAAGVIVRAGSAVRNWKIGDEVTVHCNYVDDQDPSGHDDSMRSDKPAHLGIRDELWRTRRHLGSEGQSVDAQANPFDVGGSRGQRVMQFHGVSHARLTQRRAGHAGRQRF